MKQRKFLLTAVCIAFLGISGCVTVPDQTQPAENRVETETRLEKVKKKLQETGKKLDATADKYFPQVPEKQLGERTPGMRVGYAYDFKTRPNSDIITLLKIPMCAETRDEMISYTKRSDNAAGIAAVLATPLILSAPVLVDPVLFIERGLAKSRHKTVEKTGTVTTGKLMLCGEKEPAPGETLVVQSAIDMELIHLETDPQGQFSLADIFSAAGDAPYLNIFIQQDESVYYLTTMFPHK